MPTFRKKPVTVEARQFNPAETGQTIVDWCSGQAINDAVDGPCILIDTLEGQMKALPGDWIIRGVKGEISVASSVAFEKAYEEASA